MYEFVPILDPHYFFFQQGELRDSVVILGVQQWHQLGASRKNSVSFSLFLRQTSSNLCVNLYIVSFCEYGALDASVAARTAENGPTQVYLIIPYGTFHSDTFRIRLKKSLAKYCIECETKNEKSNRSQTSRSKKNLRMYGFEKIVR